MIEHSRIKDSSYSSVTQKGEAESTSDRGTVSTTTSDGNFYRAIGRTVEDWTEVTEYGYEFKKNNLAFERVKNELFRNYVGKWVAFENGKMIVADSPEKLNLSKTAKHRIILKVTEKLLKQPKEIYLGGTSLRIK
nr:hypothetical protein [Candidatus Freyarchaeota archaeon]